VGDEESKPSRDCHSLERVTRIELRRADWSRRRNPPSQPKQSVQRMCYSVSHAELSSCVRIGRVLLHGEPAERRQTLLVDQIALLGEAVTTTRRGHPFTIDAFVVLPDHVHAIWTLPSDDRDFSIRWRLINSRFARAVPKRERRSGVRIARGERDIWQRRFWEHLIRDEADYARHVEYCYINPVKHGLVKRVRDWQYSSFHRDVAVGIVPLDWAGEIDPAGDFGER
jgi:REP-associated tyrosine transposase